MEKEIFEKDFGDSVKVEGKILDGQIQLSANVSLKPIADKVIDPLLAKLEQLIPGDWDKSILEGLKQEAYQKLGLLPVSGQ